MMKAIIVITITLSNGGTIIYEFNDNIAVKRTTIFSTNMENISTMEIISNKKDTIYEFNLIDLESQYTASPIQKQESFSNYVGNFNLNVDYVDESVLIMYSKRLLSNIHIVHYFIELDSIILPDYINSGFCTINSNQLFIYSDTFEENLRKAVAPVSIEISNEVKFSDIAQEKLNVIHSD